jgi:hypothetical protein
MILPSRITNAAPPAIARSRASGQVGSLGGQDLGQFSGIPVGGGPGDAVVPAQRLDRGPVAEPAQAQHRLVIAGQLPAAPRRPPPPPLGGQQPRGEGNQLPGHVKGGTISNHVESFGQK